MAIGTMRLRSTAAATNLFRLRPWLVASRDGLSPHSSVAIGDDDDDVVVAGSFLRTRVLSALARPPGREHSDGRRPTAAEIEIWGPRRRLWSIGGAAIRAPLTSFPLAQTGEGIAECEILQWHVKAGDRVNKFDKICEVQSDKASMEITSPHNGRIEKIHHECGDVVKVGEILVDIETEFEGASTTNVAEQQQAGENASSATDEQINRTQDIAETQKQEKTPILATPVVRAFARQNKVKLADVTPSGPNGRVLKEDVVKYIDGKRPQVEFASKLAQTELQTSKPTEKSVRIPIKGYRRAMVKTMTEAATIPHFHFCDEIDMSSIISTKRGIAHSPELDGLKITYLPFILKALSLALHDFPVVNSSLSKDKHEVIQHHDHNFGVAMATDSGLVVPNVKNVRAKSILTIAKDLQRLQDLAREGKLPVEDVTGGTLTVSNIGAIGGTYAGPLVNPPEVAIVALGRVQKLPRFDAEENVCSQTIMPITWGADHRVVDGATVALFSKAWKRFLEQPQTWLLHLR